MYIGTLFPIPYPLPAGEPMPFPLMYRVRQKFTGPSVDDVERATRETLAGLKLEESEPGLRPGQTVAITVGSRGIAHIARITRAIVAHVRELGGIPFIVPAMGSHGGATAAGQVALLAGLGVTPESVGAELRSSMETVIVATTPQGIPVHFDAQALQADHVIIAGRIKPHTMFTGEIESGLHKMMLIGLGKQVGAQIYHRAITNYSFETMIHAVAAEVLTKCRILAGVAILENADDETALIEAVRPQDFASREKELLKLAQAWLPRLPVREIDLLIVDRIGKNISGSGMDTNVIGRKYNDHTAFPGDQASCRRILVRSLTPESNGNALGIGIAEFTTQRAVDQINAEYTRVNCITAGHPTAGMIPLVYPHDQAAITDALLTIGLTEPSAARVMQIADTLHLAEVMISSACLPDAEQAGCEILYGPAPMQFDESGILRDVME